MQNNVVSKDSTIRYWERRRLIYNLALVPPSLISYIAGAAIAAVGDPGFSHIRYVLFLFIASALGANICYSFAYVLEFFFGGEKTSLGWVEYGRPAVFALGTLFAMVLGFLGGARIAAMEYAYTFK